MHLGNKVGCVLPARVLSHERSEDDKRSGSHNPLYSRVQYTILKQNYYKIRTRFSPKGKKCCIFIR